MGGIVSGRTHSGVERKSVQRIPSMYPTFYGSSNNDFYELG